MGLGHSVCDVELFFSHDILKSVIGCVYRGINVISKEDVAIKLEPIDAEHPQLDNEHKVYKSLVGGIGIPSIRWLGTEGDYNAMVHECLGPSLEDIFNSLNCKFNLKTILILADQMVSAGC